MIGRIFPWFSFIWEYYLCKIASNEVRDYATVDADIPSSKEARDDAGTVDVDIPCLPDDLLFDMILSRVPADYLVKFCGVCKYWKKLISSPYFVRLQLERASPAFLVQYSIGFTMQFHVVGETDRKNSDSDYNILMRLYSRDDKSRFNSTVILSCDGLILFEDSLCLRNRYFLFNPATYEKVSIEPPPPGVKGAFYGFFFDPIDSEYKLLFIEFNQKRTGYIYFIYNIRTRIWRRVSLRAYPYLPSYYASHATVNGALHWIPAYDYRCPINQSCENTILVYKMDTEDIFTMPHPGKEYCSIKKRHHMMYLFQKEGNLCFCNLYVHAQVVNVWILNDYANWSWNYKYNVRFDRISRGFPREIYEQNCDIKLLNICEDELFLEWKNFGIFSCHLEKNNVKKIGCMRAEEFGRVSHISTTAFTRSLVTLL